MTTPLPARHEAAITQAVAHALPNLAEIVARMKGEHGWEHSPCDPKKPDSYSFERCETPTPGPSGGTPYVRGDYHDVDENDVRQGQMGDCYVLSSLAALARNVDGRDILRRAIRETTHDGARFFVVTLRVPDGRHGWTPKEIEVPDRFIPSSSRTGDTKGAQVELWPKIFEAAVAKHLGGLDAMGHGGHAAAILPLLTGVRARAISGSELWPTWAAGGVAVVSVHRLPEGKPPPYGLVARHAYSVENLFSDASGRRFVQLRNPWGDHHPAPIPLDELGRLGITIDACPRPKR